MQGRYTIVYSSVQYKYAIVYTNESKLLRKKNGPKEGKKRPPKKKKKKTKEV